MERIYYLYDKDNCQTITKYEEVKCPMCSSIDIYEVSAEEPQGEPWDKAYYINCKCNNCGHEFDFMDCDTYEL